MLGQRYWFTINRKSILSELKNQRFSVNATTKYNKNKSNLNRQAKMMGKLFGERLTGSKKRWYPTTETNRSKNELLFMFKPKEFAKPGGTGKNTLRRKSVLNKLFMEEVSSLLATGGASECFLGRGLQLTRVKIASDFTCVNIYWLGKGDLLTDSELANDLNRCSGLLRHELSQLRIMGEVPRINFLQDKTFANIEQVEDLLRNMKFDEQEESLENSIECNSHVKEEFYGHMTVDEKNDITDERLPPMRQDVFGLDHRSIRLQILTKMRKNKQAWDAYSESSKVEKPIEDSSILKTVQQKIMVSSEASSENFKKFLAQRRERKNTPERKKYRRSDDISFVSENNENDNESLTLPKILKPYANEEDYLLEDIGSDKKD